MFSKCVRTLLRSGALLLLAGVTTALCPPAWGDDNGGSGYRLLYSFAGSPDGSNPATSLIRLKKTLYAVTPYGGSQNNGTIFAITKKGAEQDIHYFLGAPGDGANPSGPLEPSYFFGVTAGGGLYSEGTLYEISPAGQEYSTYSFCQKANCTDGQNPSGRLALGSYGFDSDVADITTSGGANNHGLIYTYQIGGSNEIADVYDFCQQANCADGANPVAGLGAIPNSDGAGFYGTTTGGGSGNGVLFTVDLHNGYHVLHAFDYSEGQSLSGLPVRDNAGNYYGVASGGGTANDGTVWAFTAKGKLVVLYNFTNLSDGGFPAGDLVRDSSGNLYGTAQGGAGGCGVVFKVTPQRIETVLHAFTCKPDGAYPQAGLLQVRGKNGTLLYGTTQAGGTNDLGTVFVLHE